MRRVSVILGVAFGLFVAVASSSAGSLPAEALSRLSAPQLVHGYVEDTIPGPGRPYQYAFRNYPDGNAMQTVALAHGKMRVAQDLGQAVAVTDFKTSSYRRTGRRTLRFRGWEVGGIHLTPRGTLYVMVGRSNYRESRSLVVIEIHKFDQQLRSQGVAKITGGYDELGIYRPFVGSMSSMIERNGTLIVHAAREIFRLPGEDEFTHHQMNLTFAIDDQAMRLRPKAEVHAPRVGHSFRQYVDVRGDDAVYLDHGDANPRALQIGVNPGFFTPERGFTPLLEPDCSEDRDGIVECVEMQPPAYRRYSILRFGGKSGDNYTGTTVNGFQVSTTYALTVGVSVPHGHPVRGVRGRSSKLVRNAYVISTDLTSGASRFTWLTKVKPTAKNVSVSEPAIASVGDGRYVVMFTGKASSSVRMHYALIDERGTVLRTRSWAGKQFAAMGSPVRVGRKLFWINDVIQKHPSDRIRYRYRGYYLQALDIKDPRWPRLITR